MKRAVLILVVATALMAVSCSDGNGGNDGGGSTAATVEVAETVETGITVTGVGEVFGSPDTMTLTIGVRVTSPTVDEALEQASGSTEAVIDALVDSGVDSDDIQTQQFSIHPEYNFVNDSQVLIGFTVTNTVIAKLRDLDEAGATIDAAVAAGGDDTIVQGVGFSIEDDAERLTEARERAWIDAEAKAAHLAELAGVELGPALQISEGVRQTEPGFEMRLAADAAAASVPIEPGQVTSTVTIGVRFAIDS